MNASTISQWLRSPDDLPDTHELTAAVAKWPWFAPIRLMAAMHSQRRDNADLKALDTLRLYCGHCVQAYQLLATVKEQHYRILQAKELAAELKSATHEEVPLGNVAAIEKPEDRLLIQPHFTEDYFRHEGIEVADNIEAETPSEPQTLMVMMSFSEWLSHYKVKTEKEESEAREKRALRSMWQQEKLAAALEDEPDEIPEDVFEMAVSSITREDDLVSESLAKIFEKQEKWSAAADMYRRLALINPEKSSYFAARAEAAKKRLP